MSELGGLDIGMPSEGQTGAPEQLSEEAKQRFAAAAAAMQQIRREEKKAKKRDDNVAQVIVQFLGNSQHTHLFLLISRLVARDCPSIFILSILSLIHEQSRVEVTAYLKDTMGEAAEQTTDETMALMKTGQLDESSNAALVQWITRMQMVLSTDTKNILTRLLIDDRNIDGTVLQLTTFVIQEFFEERKKQVAFEKLQPLTASILQTVFEPFIKQVHKKVLEKPGEEE